MRTWRSRLAFLVVVVLTGILIGLPLKAHFSDKRDELAAKIIFPTTPAERLLWPSNQSWVWEVRLPDAAAEISENKCVALIARTVHRDVKENITPAIDKRIITAQDAEDVISFGMIGLGDTTKTPAVACVQLINLKEIGIASTEETKPFRLLMKLSHGYSEINNWSSDACIEAEKSHGSVVLGEKWEGGELHLLNLYVQAGKQVIIYDFILSLNETPCSHHSRDKSQG